MAGTDSLSSRTPLDHELRAQAEAAERPIAAEPAIAGGDAWVMAHTPSGQLWTAAARPQIRVIDQRPAAGSSVHRLPALAVAVPAAQA